MSHVRPSSFFLIKSDTEFFLKSSLNMVLTIDLFNSTDQKLQRQREETYDVLAFNESIAQPF